MTNNNLPDISIIVPIYNSAEFLKQCVGSLINQTFQNIEIILVNDGSPDNSEEICKEYEKNDSRVKYIFQENSGQAVAWAKATNVAKGEFIIYLDADDWYNENTCQLAYETIIRENADIVMWPFIKEYRTHSIAEKSVFLNYTVFEGEDLRNFRYRAMGLIRQELNNPVRTDAFNSVWGKIYRKEMIIKNNISFESTSLVGCTDVLFNNEIYQFVSKVVYLNKHLTHYRQDNPNSLTKNYKFELSSRYIELFSRLEKRIVLKDASIEMKKAYLNRVAVSLLNIGLSIASPNLKGSLTEKRKHIKDILNKEPFMSALSQLSIKYMPIYWRFFFLACKWKNGMLVFILSKLMIRLR